MGFRKHPFEGRVQPDFRNIAYKEKKSFDGYEYAFGIERLADFKDFLHLAGEKGLLLTGNYFLWNALFGAELRAVLRYPHSRLTISSGLGAAVAALRDKVGAHRIHIFREGEEGFQHAKYVFIKTADKGYFRIGTGPMATANFGLFQVGSKGVGRTEFFFQTTHPPLVGEGEEFSRALDRGDFPRSGDYLLVQTSDEDGILPALTKDLEALAPGMGEIIHARASIEPGLRFPARQDNRNLLQMHQAMENAFASGTRGMVLSDAPDRQTRMALQRFSRVGAVVRSPRFLPGSTLPKWVRRVPVIGTFFNKNGASEHYNMTLIRGLKDRNSGTYYSVTYLGQKRDTAQTRGAVEAMVRLDSREFPGVLEGFEGVLRHRFSGPPLFPSRGVSRGPISGAGRRSHPASSHPAN